MSVAGADPAKHEIVIIKRHGGDHEDGHHGGAWKIAFADFMTAMMCFFLVMWLINASNEQTKASVASYFNPVKLIDRNSSRKGLDEVGESPPASGAPGETQATEPKVASEGSGDTGPATNAESRDDTQAERRTDEHLFADPYAVLAEIAADTGKLQNISAKGDGGAQEAGPATGASGGESYRDPFAPDFWVQQVKAPSAAVDITDASTTAREASGAPAPEVDAELAAMQTQPQDADPARDAALAELTAEAEPAKDAPPVAPEAAKVQEEKVEEPAPPATGATREAIAKAEKIRDALAEAFGRDEALADNIDVAVKDGTVIISVTDQLDFGMFEIGSAVPRAELVRAMEKIGRIVAAQEGEVKINGHTDARPFRSAQYDNWRLSSARAQSAYYMLVRGGLAENRVKEVSGFADRRLKAPEDPLGAANRRIEILIETGA